MPASFPTSVKAFSVKADGPGNVISAAHINDLQDEVTAVEGGLLQGTAPLNSSNSTVANLSVTGGSTLAGALSVAGSLTVSSNLTVTGTVTVGPFAFSTTVTANLQPRCRVFHGSTQTIQTSSETALTFNTNDFDPQALHSTSVQPTRITLQSTGVWLFGAHVTMGVTGVGFTAGDAYIRFRKNGATAMGTKAGIGGVAGSIVAFSHSQLEVIASTGDYVEVLAFQNSGSPVQVGGASSRVDQNEVYAVKLW